MKKAQFVLGLAIGLAITSSQAVLAQGRNEIYGTVFGETGRPVPDIFVELLSDTYATVGRRRTDGSGRFSFNGLGEGRHKVKVLPYGTDYMEQTQEVVLASVSATPGSGSDRQYIDIYLRFNERANAGPFSVTRGVVFVQDVPDQARRLYQDGVRYLREKNEKNGLQSLKEAIEVFPNYYEALDRLGAEYAMRGAKDRSYYEAGIVLLTRAAEINTRSFSSFFGLGWIQYHLGITKQAIESFKRATELDSKVPETYLWLGKALRRASTIDQAEEALKRANVLAKGKVGEVHWQLAGVYREQKRYKEAADELELFLKAEPKAADAEKIREAIKQLRVKTDGV
ncbi:MAG: carboxypeptidase regulatory-like domain-containing protein [Pyrinomonadaceae bacterium]